MGSITYMFTPELLLLNSNWRKMLKGPVYEERLKALVFDEANCIKESHRKYNHSTSNAHQAFKAITVSIQSPHTYPGWGGGAKGAAAPPCINNYS